MTKKDSNKDQDSDNSASFFDYEYLSDERIIHIGTPDSSDRGSESQITCNTAMMLLKQLTILELQSKTAEIKINLMTYGGDSYAGMAIYDMMKACRCPISVQGIGMVMSAGAYILQGATPGRRLLSANTVVMLHDGEDSRAGHPRDMEKWGEFSSSFRSRIYNIFAENCGDESIKSHKADWWRKKLNIDWIMWAEDAVKFNIADGITDRNF